MSTQAVEFASQTDVGQKRQRNEDNFLVDKKLSLFIVCDGMGGHAGGDVASALAVRTVHDEVKKELGLLEDYQAAGPTPSKVNKREILNMLEFAANRASRRVHAEAIKDPQKRGMGTTLVAVLFIGSRAFIVHVGDSRIYLLRGGVLEQLTEDHNVYNELIKRKRLTLEQAEKLAPKNAITRAVGVYEHCEPDSLVVDVAPGDVFLLCTDGLYEYFEPPAGRLEELAQALLGEKLDDVVGELIQTANLRGGRDNITSIVVRVSEAGADAQSQLQRLQARRDLLANMPLFKPLNDAELRRVLQVVEVRQFADQDAVITQGERGDELFIVLSGSVAVMKGGAAVASLQRGEHFGEMALIRSQPRSATVLSAGPSELMVIRRSDFFEILRSESQLAVKLLWQFTGVLADRLAETTRDLGQAREELAIEDVTSEIFAEEEDDRRTVRLPPPPPPKSLRAPKND